MSPNFFDIYFPLIFFSIFLFVFIFSIHSGKGKFKNLLNFPNGRISKFSLIPTFKGQYQGLDFSIYLLPAGKGSPPYLMISVLKSASFTLHIYKETGLTKLGKKLGMVREVEINDELFDDKFVLSSNNRTQTVNYLNNSTIKNTIKELFDNGFIELIINRKGACIKKPNYIVEKDITMQNITTILQKLNLLARGLYGE